MPSKGAKSRKGQKWRIGALLEDKRGGPVVVIDCRAVERDGRRVMEYQVAPGAWAMPQVRDESRAKWVPESQLRDQPE